MNHYFISRPAALTFAVLLIIGVLGIYALPFAGAARAQSKPAGKGSFKVGFSPLSKNKNLKSAMNAEARKALQELADDMNKVFALPQDLYFTEATCGEANAFYDPDAKQITMCIELIKDLEKSFGKEFKDKQEAAEAVEDATLLIFFQELGHALIDLYDLPVTGKEEDAVDQLAALIVADGSPEGAAAVFNGALSFALAAGDGDLDESAFSDEHSLNQQRFYNLVCLLYGQDPKTHQGLVKENVLPKQRAQQCPSEYDRADKAWSKLLSPHLKN